MGLKFGKQTEMKTKQNPIWHFLEWVSVKKKEKKNVTEISIGEISWDDFYHTHLIFHMLWIWMVMWLWLFVHQLNNISVKIQSGAFHIQIKHAIYEIIELTLMWEDFSTSANITLSQNSPNSFKWNKRFPSNFPIDFAIKRKIKRIRMGKNIHFSWCNIIRDMRIPSPNHSASFIFYKLYFWFGYNVLFDC